MEIFKNDFDKVYETLSDIDTLSDKGFSNPSEEPLSAADIQTAINNASSVVKSLFETANASISFETILSLINNSSLTIEEQLEAWSLIIKIISTKYNRAFMKDSHKTWEERLAGFISVYGVEVAIKNSLEDYFKETFDFTDIESHNLLFAEHGDDVPDLVVSPNNTSDKLYFEIKPLNSTSSVHDADFVVRYSATTTSVKFKIVPYKANNINWDKLRDTIESNFEFEAALDPNLRVTAGKIKVLYDKLLKTSGTAESTAELEYRSALTKATNAHKKAEQREKSFLKATLEQEKKVIAGKDSKEVLKQQAKALKDFAALEKTVTQTIDTLVTTTTTTTDTHVETSVSEDLDSLRDTTSLLELFSTLDWPEYTKR